MNHYLMYIDGQWEGEQLETLSVINPANRKVIGTVPVGGEKEANAAIESAYEAFQSWSKTTAYERANYLKRLYNLLIEHQEELAQIMTLEMGKPIQESRGEVLYAASYIEWFAEEGKRVYGETIPAHVPNKRMQVWKKPVGVVAAITPWNFPLAMLTRKLAPALAAGCTFVMKPSGESPISAVKLAELCEKAGIPKGVVNLVTGSSSAIGNAFMENAKVRKVTFTGSTGVGKQLIQQSAEQVKKLSLELGGHAPIIVLDDAELDVAVAGAMASKFRNAGQTCVCGNRIYVQEKVYEAFLEKFTAAVETLRMGDGSEETVQIGPLINDEAVEKVSTHVEEAVKSGATVLTGGRKNPELDGSYYQPTVLRDATATMLVMNEETFGPVAPVQKFTTIEEVIELANDTPYGLAAYVFTESISKGTTLIEHLDYGIVGWNDGAPSAAQAPFGGMKESGIGREGGKEGIEGFLETQYVSIGIN